MPFEPFWVRPLKFILAITLLMAAYAWTSADEWDDEFDTQPPVYPTLDIAVAEEPEPPAVVPATEPEPVFIPAPEGVVKKAKRAVSKAKRNVRRALTPNN